MFKKHFGLQNLSALTFSNITGTDKNGKTYDLLNDTNNTNYIDMVNDEKEKVKNMIHFASRMRHILNLQYITKTWLNLI